MKTSKNKDIYIFDNVYDTHITQKFYYFIIGSQYKISLKDTSCKDYHSEESFGAIYSMKDISNMGIIQHLPENIKNTPLSKLKQGVVVLKFFYWNGEYQLTFLKDLF